LRGGVGRRRGRDLGPVLAALRGRGPRVLAHHRPAHRKARDRRAGGRQRRRRRRDARRCLVDGACGDGRGRRLRVRAGARTRSAPASRRPRRDAAHDARFRSTPAAMSPAHPPPPRWRAALGNGAILAVLLATALALLPLHGDAWWPAMPRPRDWWSAAASLALYLGLCAWRLPRGRERRANDDVAALPWLVAHASQTGFAV